MPATHQTQDVPYAADEMFALVAGVELYPEFLPWCAGARIRRREADGQNEVLIADLIVSYKVFREQFTSRVVLDRANRTVDVHYVQGPFRHLANKWNFEPLPEGGTRIHFFIDFEFRSATLQKLMNGVFGKAFARMMQAFIDRADSVYGKPAPALAAAAPLPETEDRTQAG